MGLQQMNELVGRVAKVLSVTSFYLNFIRTTVREKYQRVLAEGQVRCRDYELVEKMLLIRWSGSCVIVAKCTNIYCGSKTLTVGPCGKANCTKGHCILK